MLKTIVFTLRYDLINGARRSFATVALIFMRHSTRQTVQVLWTRVQVRESVKLRSDWRALGACVC